MSDGMPIADFRYRAFISYSHRDESWAKSLHRWLETYRVPHRLVGRRTSTGVIPARIAPVFRDRDELPTAADLSRKVTEALQQSACLIVICSPRAIHSRWLDEEIRAFKRMGRAERILCLIVDGEPHAGSILGREPEECFPPALFENAKPGEENAEPLAADARSGKDGRRGAFLKLAAGVLGVEFSELKLREQQTRYRRLVAVAGCALVALLIVAGLAVAALKARNDADRRRAQAEDLVGFMLGDLSEKLQQAGKLDILDSVGQRAAAYYAQQNPNDLNSAALSQRARALHMLGEVRDLKGDLDSGLALFRQAASSTNELLSRSPNDAQTIFDHAQSVYWVGYVAWQRGNPTEAESSFREYQDLANRLVAMDPDKPEWQAEVEYANSNLGTLLLDQGRAKEAAAAFERSLQISLLLAQRAPQDADRQVEAAQSRAWLADALGSQGLFLAAIEQRKAELDVYNALLTLGSKDRGIEHSIAIAHRSLASLLISVGDLDGGVGHLEHATTVADGLLKDEPGNTQWADTASAIYGDYAEALLGQGRTGQAELHGDRAIEISSGLTTRDHSVLNWRDHLYHAQLIKGRIEAARGNGAGALALTQEVIGQIESGRSGASSERSRQTLYSSALLTEGSLLEKLGKHAQAMNSWQKLVEALPSRCRDTPPQVQAAIVNALRNLGRVQDTLVISECLAQLGYKAR